MPTAKEVDPPLEAPPMESDPDDLPQAPPFDASAATERILLLTSEGPLIVGFVLAIEGRPFRQARQEVLRRMLQAADKDGDGQLTWSEAIVDPQFAFGDLAELRNLNGQQRRERIAQYDQNRNGLVEATEAELFVAQSDGAGATFALEAETLASESPSRDSELWRLLDTDSDGALSDAERGAAEARLRSADRNDDELVAYDEVFGQAEAAPTRSTNTYAPPAAARLGDEANWGEVFYAIDQRYLYDGELTEESFSLRPELAAQLDADGGGYLDRGEARRLNDLEADLVVEVNFGDSPERPRAMTIRSVAPWLQEATSQEAIPGGVSLKLGGVSLRLVMSDAPGATADEETTRSQWSTADADSNGYLDKDELGRLDASAAEAFEALDSDGDGKLYLEEWLEIVRWRGAPLRSRVRIRAAGVSESLFAALDTGGDRKLSPREMRQAAERLSAFDKNGDARISPAELPGGLSVEVVRGAGGVVPGNESESSSETSAPIWLRAMDTNGDGEISRREFLGTGAQFQSLDSNRDGFITAAEAADLPLEAPP